MNNKVKKELWQKRAKRVTRLLVLYSIALFAGGISATSFGYQFVFYVIILGLMPSILTHMMDFRPGKPASKTIIAFNLAGLSQPLNTMVTAGSPNQAAEFILQHPTHWLIAYGFAAFGAGLIYVLPMAAGIYLDIKARYIVTKMREVQDELEKEWGEEVKR